MEAAAKHEWEFGLGETFVFAVVWKWAIEIIDAYARWEMATGLDRHLHFLASPITVPIVLIFGLILIHRSLQSRLVASFATPSALRDASGKTIVHKATVPSVWITILVVFGAFLTAGVYAILWIMFYNPAPNLLAQVIPVPSICKTQECWPKSKPQHGEPLPDAIAQSGKNNIAQVGNNNSATITGAIPFRTLTETQRQGIMKFVKTLPESVLVSVGGVYGSGDAVAMQESSSPSLMGDI